MPGWRGVTFDLFGTLVPAFRRASHDEVLGSIAGLLGLGFRAADRAMREGYLDRVCGRAGLVPEYLASLARAQGHDPSPDAVRTAMASYNGWAMDSLEPLPGVLELLAELVSSEVRLALISNASPDVAGAWPRTKLAGYFDHVVLSCDVGVSKPDPAIYRKAIEALELSASEVLFVGDGSDGELQGARISGMDALLVIADRSDTYDSDLYHRLRWEGPSVANLTEVGAVVASGQLPRTTETARP